MASSSEKTPSSSGQNTSLTLGSDFPGLACLRDFNSALEELSQKKNADPAYIQATEVFRTASIQGDNLCVFDRKQLSDAMPQLSQISRNHLLQNPHISKSLENFGNPVALKQFADSLAQMGKDNPELRHLLAEIDSRGPAAVARYWDDKDALKKLSKSMGTDIENDDEQVKQGLKALQILCGYGKMKAANLCWEARHKKKNKFGRKKKRASLILDKDAAATLQNVESKTPVDVATTSSI